jgi:RNA polymerase sigma-70 factor (ECF subfamily)
MTDPGEEASAGDKAFVAALTASQREMWAFILSVVPTQVDADDVLQEVNLALWGKRHLYDPKKRFMPWALAFAVREIRSFRSRSVKRRLWFSDEAILSIAETWAEPDTFVEDSRRLLSGCLQKLGEAERIAIEDKYGKQLSVQQMASNSGKSLSAVYKTLNRALHSLRECVKRTQLQAEH